jgi:hypothetical protein
VILGADDAGLLMQGVAGRLMAWGAPGVAAEPAPGCWREGGGGAEPADQRVKMSFRVAVPP